MIQNRCDGAAVCQLLPVCRLLYLSLQLDSECVEVEVLESIWTVKDLLQRSGGISVLRRVVILQCVHGHLPRPVVCLRVDTS